MNEEPVPGEIWADAEGTLMCRSSSHRWWMFGVRDPIPDDEPLIVKPLRRVYDHVGQFQGVTRLYDTPQATAALQALGGES